MAAHIEAESEEASRVKRKPDTRAVRMTTCSFRRLKTHAAMPTASGAEPSAVRVMTLKVFQIPRRRHRSFRRRAKRREEAHRGQYQAQRGQRAKENE